MAAPSSHHSVKDWSALVRARHTFTTEQLQKFNAAGVDPYLIQIAQLTGLQFNISLQGQRNLANALSSLPQTEFYGQRIGIGFSDRHIARILAESDGGFAFLGILGCLGEYFASDVVVAVIMKLASTIQVDEICEGSQPSDFQWKRLVRLCQGVLATSPVGTLITRNHQSLRTSTDHVNVAQIVEGLMNMSRLVGGGAQKFSLEHAGSDVFWFATVAEYLFDLKVAVQDLNGTELYSQPGVGATLAQFVLRSGVPVYSDDAVELLSLSKAFPDFVRSHGPFDSSALNTGTVLDHLNKVPLVGGGRVTWEKLFRSCFGRTFTDIEPSLVAEFTGGAASLLSSALQYGQTRSQEFFLPHASTVRGLSGYGLVETVTSWFPELRRMAPQMGKAARLPFQQARDRLDEISATLDSSCMCSSCGNAPATSTEFCKHSVVETILELGLYIARTVVIPNLFPKRAGVMAFYERLHAARLIYRAQEAPTTEAFLKRFAAALPTPRNMIETMCLLFVGSVPKDLVENPLSVSYEGITVSVSAWNPNSGVRDPENEHVVIRQRAGVNVSAGSSHLNGRIFDHGYWMPFENKRDDGQSEVLSFGQCFELLRTKPKEVRQIVKPKMGNLMISYIRADKTEEGRARKLGWLVL
ncbi:hypothetical protein PV04_08309 [Phialophora macrospora]|uniref:Uncharacterized protein n=1 Tax=Phialophora macrospora TaxID=1851006 RepID=A0A0D2FH63_9EURO|nr:hypothetical protein PV04_08309 [Phialophora macrospora]